MAEYPGELVLQEWVFPAITTTGALGREMTWTISVSAQRNGERVAFPDLASPSTDLVGVMEVSSGYVGGKVRASAQTLVERGKNVGKKNETTPIMQAMREAHSKWKKQNRVSVGKPESASISSDLQPPMLAATRDITKTVYPAAVQPKLDGLRALFSGAGFTSRTAIQYNIAAEIVAEAAALLARVQTESPHAVALDGELYIHGTGIQQLNHLVRGTDHSVEQLAAGLEYHIYDVQDLTSNFATRSAALRPSVPSPSPHIRIVPTTAVANAQELEVAYGEFLADQYEGAIIRNPLSLYEPAYKNFRSRGLVKMKPAMDGEFEIVAWWAAANGKAKDALMITCRTEAGATFNVTPALPIEQRVAMAKSMPAEFDTVWRGKKIIVRFAQLSKDGIPLQPRTEMVIREWE